jgi:hypothetical protein
MCETVLLDYVHRLKYRINVSKAGFCFHFCEDGGRWQETFMLGGGAPPPPAPHRGGEF